MSKAQIWDKLTDGQKEAIIEYISELELNDVENSIRNAKRCLEGQGYHELQVMVHNHFYYAGMNAAKNELREIVGLPRLMTDQEKKEFEYNLKHPMGSREWWDCPPLQDHEFEVVEGSAKLIPLGEGDSMVVIGTKDRKKAARMMRRCQRDWLDADLLVQDTELEAKKMVWRKAGDEDGEHTHMFSWHPRNTKNNAKAIDVFVYEA